MTITNSIFQGNHAFDGGGAIWANYETFQITILNSHFVGNSGSGGTGTGGAVEVASYSGGEKNTVTIKVKNSTFHDNWATAGGGAFYISWDNAKVEMQHTRFLTNRAKNYGGGIHFASTSGKLGLKDVEIRNCSIEHSEEFAGTGESSGGGVNIFANNAWIDLTRVTCRENSAEYGGCVSFSGKDSNIQIGESHFVANKAMARGGSLDLEGESIIAIRLSYFENNPERIFSRKGDIIYSATACLEFDTDVEAEGTTILNITSSQDHHEHVSFQQWGTHIHRCIMPFRPGWDTKVLCPLGTRIDPSSLRGFEDAEYIGPYSTEFKLRCNTCPNKMYTLENNESFWMLLYDTVFSENENWLQKYDERTCFKCPYGAWCSEQIKPLPGFWGYFSGKDGIFQPCPEGYCCSEDTECSTYDSCSATRAGVLCSECRVNRTESLFTAACVEDEYCDDTNWIIVAFSIVVVVYSCTLIFWHDAKALCKSIFKKIYKGCFKLLCKASCLKRKKKEDLAKGKSTQSIEEQSTVLDDEEKHIDKKDDEVHVQPEQEIDKANVVKDSGSQQSATKFLVILLYYIQDASLFTVKEITETEKQTDKLTMIANIFVESVGFSWSVLMTMFNQICILPGIFNPVLKLLVKSLLGPFIITFLFILYITFKLYEVCQRKGNIKWKWPFMSRLATALTLTMLFSFQTLAKTTFSLLNCVSYHDHLVLFIDAQISCYTSWQFAVMIYGCTCVIPFFLVIAIGPYMMKYYGLDVRLFFFYCLFPLPFFFHFFYILLERIREKPSIVWKTEETYRKRPQKTPNQVVYETLQNPYRPIKLFKIEICSAGIIKLQRLLLVMAKVFINNIVIQICAMLLVSLSSTAYHFSVKPYIDRKANLVALFCQNGTLIFGVTNLIKAMFQSMEYEPQGPMVALIQVLDISGDILLKWGPIVLLLFMLVFSKVARILCHRRRRI